MAKSGTSRAKLACALWLGVALLVQGCGSEGSAQTDVPLDSSTTESIASTTVAVEIEKGPEPTAAVDSLGLADLVAVKDATVALPRAAFELNVRSTLPGVPEPVNTISSGSFDDVSLSGFGSRSFQTENAELQQLWGSEDFEFRLVGLTYWFYNPLASEPRWAGFDVVEFATVTGADPLGSIDGDAYLEVLIESIARITEVQTDPDGGRVWLTEALADDLLPIVASAGPAARLTGAGAADTGLEVSVELRQSSDGYLEGFSIDMSEWWTEAVSLVEPSAGDLSSQVDFTLTLFDDPLALEQPCEDPSTETTSEGVTGLICAP